MDRQVLDHVREEEVGQAEEARERRRRNGRPEWSALAVEPEPDRDQEHDHGPAETAQPEGGAVPADRLAIPVVHRPDAEQRDPEQAERQQGWQEPGHRARPEEDPQADRGRQGEHQQMAQPERNAQRYRFDPGRDAEQHDEARDWRQRGEDDCRDRPGDEHPIGAIRRPEHQPDGDERDLDPGSGPAPGG